MFPSKEKRELQARIRQLEQVLSDTKQKAMQPFEEYKISQVEKWEYLVEEGINNAQLDNAGRAGWELVACISYNMGNTNVGTGITDITVDVTQLKVER